MIVKATGFVVSGGGGSYTRVTGRGGYLHVGVLVRADRGMYASLLVMEHETPSLESSTHVNIPANHETG